MLNFQTQPSTDIIMVAWHTPVAACKFSVVAWTQDFTKSKQHIAVLIKELILEEVISSTEGYHAIYLCYEL